MSLVDSTFAGSWYPATKKAIDVLLGQFQENVRYPQRLKKPPIAGIVPHAGWQYSGQIAYEVWANLAKRDPNLVVLFGGHVHQYQRSKIFVGDGFKTPLGPVHTYHEIVKGLSGAFRFRPLDEEAWEPDNTIETQLPFIRHLMPNAKILVLLLPPRDIILDIVDLIMEFVRRNDARPIFVGSTDLTHYGPRYGFTSYGVGEKAHRWAKGDNDSGFIDKLLSLDPQGCLEEGLSNHNACCPGAAAAAVTAARLMGSEYGELLTHSTSFEVAPMADPVDFVGYCSVVF